MEALKQVVEKFKHGAFSDLADLAQHDSIKTQESGGNQSRSTCSSPETVPPTNCFSPETEPPTVPSTELNPEEAPSNEDNVPAIGGMPDRVAGVLDYGNSTVGCGTTVHSELVVQPSEKCTQPTGVCTQTDSGITPHQVDLNLENTEFDIASPPRARGRPKVKPKSVEAKRNLGVALAAEDAETFDSQLSLASVAQVVANAPTSGLAERDVAIEIIGLGVFSTETLTIMKTWHRAMETIKQIDKIIKWAEAIDFGSQVPEEFRTQRADNLPTKIYDLPLLSPKSEILELAAKGWISDATMCMMLNTIFGSNESILTIDPSTTVIVIDGKISTARTTLQNIFSAIKEEVVLIPINCNGNHWCSIVVRLETSEVCYYDPMHSSYVVSVRAVAETLATMLPKPPISRYRVRLYDADLGTQLNNYNCGMYLLLAFEMFVGARGIETLDRKLVQYLRYRYLRMCI
ncbi:unnamed protein product [Phytophthora fragariaefolia]|uniref:Unnamed protein product n=1 Tax=Phytophthora fragariaefolia TaxID=1490495 RepID=A0A9W6XKN1_9STRA|nr:unnamed protein product [Phytophthora fragariaefolia]